MDQGETAKVHGCEYYCLAKCFEPVFSRQEWNKLKYFPFSLNSWRFIAILAGTKWNIWLYWRLFETRRRKQIQNQNELFHLLPHRVFIKSFTWEAIAYKMFKKKKKTRQQSERAETMFDAKTSRAAVVMIKCIRLDKLHSQQNDDDKNRKLFYHQNCHWSEKTQRRRWQWPPRRRGWCL